jgi:hypothetical protein
VEDDFVAVVAGKQKGKGKIRISGKNDKMAKTQEPGIPRVDGDEGRRVG